MRNFHILLSDSLFGTFLTKQSKLPNPKMLNIGYTNYIVEKSCLLLQSIAQSGWISNSAHIQVSHVAKSCPHISNRVKVTQSGKYIILFIVDPAAQQHTQ